MEASWVYWSLIVIFVLSYVAILFEPWIRVNKAAIALLAALISWCVLFGVVGGDQGNLLLRPYLQGVSQLVFFIFGALTLAELVQAHGGFTLLSSMIYTTSKHSLIILMSVMTFMLSAVLDNLTTTIVMIALLKKLLPEGQERLFMGALVVIAANAGGAWTPVGDVTTTMLWIQDKVTPSAIMNALFLPSAAALGAAVGCSYRYTPRKLWMQERQEMRYDRMSLLILWMGVGIIMSVPLLKTILGIPPFMSVLLGVALLWAVTDLLHASHAQRQHLRLHQILSQVDTSGLFFFLGILLGVDVLDVVGLLRAVEDILSNWFVDHSQIAIAIGFVSAIIDNIPLVAAALGMYSEVPRDDPFWHLLAYCAGTGGSLLPIGSAAGVVFMQMEKVPFIWYVKKMTPIAAASYITGVAVYLIMR